MVRPRGTTHADVRTVQLQKVLFNGLMGFSKDGSVDASYQLFTLQGKAVKKSWQADKGASKNMLSGSIQVFFAK